jgi:xanthine/uracil permease
MANSFASSLQQVSIGFGLACGSLVAAWYLGDSSQADRWVAVVSLHHAFLTLGALTILSSLAFWTLHANDGATMSMRTRVEDQP